MEPRAPRPDRGTGDRHRDAGLAERATNRLVAGSERHVAAGLLVPLVLGRSRQDRVGAYVAAVPALALGAVGFAVFIWIYDVTSRIQG